MSEEEKEDLEEEFEEEDLDSFEEIEEELDSEGSYDEIEL